MSNKELTILGKALKALYKAGLMKELEEILDIMSDSPAKLGQFEESDKD
ncbi:MAG: hypothetical protein LBR85_04505 [Oscillospiraceae bacterium]|nr:hypothetical protein [Oscillospiraceae bacterium]